MATNAYPISVPAEFYGTGALYINHTGATNHNFQDTFNFVTGAQGALYHVGAASQVKGLGIGTAGQVLRVNAGATGPEWYTLASAGPLFSAFATAPDGATFAANDNWTTLNDTYVTWDTTAAPGVDDPNFDISTGVYTVPAGGDGVYEFACSIVYTGNNSGNGAIITTPPLGRSMRQVQLYRTNGGGLSLAISSRQAEPSKDNPTQVSIHNCKVSLVENDTVVVQARHDANVPLGILGDNRVSFSASRVR